MGWESQDHVQTPAGVRVRLSPVRNDSHQPPLVSVDLDLHESEPPVLTRGGIYARASPVPPWVSLASKHNPIKTASPALPPPPRCHSRNPPPVSQTFKRGNDFVPECVVWKSRSGDPKAIMLRLPCQTRRARRWTGHYDYRKHRLPVGVPCRHVRRGGDSCLMG